MRFALCRDICTAAPVSYKAPEFEVKALQNTEVELTWDETPKDRLAITQTKMRSGKDLDTIVCRR